MTLRALAADPGNLLERKASVSSLDGSTQPSLSLAQIKMDQTGENFLQSRFKAWQHRSIGQPAFYPCGQHLPSQRFHSG